MALLKYEKIAASLRLRIAAGEFAPGEVLPSGRELAAQWSVSRATAIKAMEVLRGAGLVEARQGIGHIVTETPAQHPAGSRRSAMQDGAARATYRGVLGVVASAAGGVESLRTGLVEPAIARGWQVAVTLTPTACQWLRDSGEFERLEKVTGLPVRDRPRLPSEASPHPAADCHVLAPASASSVAKLALGLMDNQALTQVGEAIGTLGKPVVVFPRVNAAHARHPAWERHLETLQAGGVHLVYGPEVWPLYEPLEGLLRRPLPWRSVLELVDELTRQ
ncbi:MULTISPECIES: GntR family transcriptional regulator [Streptomyces]|uniref:GntR family transcriptional regulator n=1 Tax=Streptomyces griseocarneus TaxID=51201 RepID=A0ABX7RTF0_9ACTN|nr:MULTISPECIES: GntR family transcriptional regulator [Streptomyces]QSY50199.1 GntR family transcriptional regulator [Streptomyces griseocarneus]